MQKKGFRRKKKCWNQINDVEFRMLRGKKKEGNVKHIRGRRAKKKKREKKGEKGLKKEKAKVKKGK